MHYYYLLLLLFPFLFSRDLHVILSREDLAPCERDWRCVHVGIFTIINSINSRCRDGLHLRINRDRF